MVPIPNQVVLVLANRLFLILLIFRVSLKPISELAVLTSDFRCQVGDQLHNCLPILIVIFYLVFSLGAVTVYEFTVSAVMLLFLVNILTLTPFKQAKHEVHVNVHIPCL